MVWYIGSSLVRWFLLRINDRQCPIIIKRSDRRITKAIKRKGISAKDVFDVVTAVLGLNTNWAVISLYLMLNLDSNWWGNGYNLSANSCWQFQIFFFGLSQVCIFEFGYVCHVMVFRSAFYAFRILVHFWGLAIVWVRDLSNDITNKTVSLSFS